MQLAFIKNNTNTVPVGHVKNNYKTVYCKFYMQDGHCSFGDRWTYAHGEADLRPAFISAEEAQMQDGGFAGMNAPDQDMQQYDNNDGIGQVDYNFPDSGAYNTQDSNRELDLELIEDSDDVKRNIFETVNWLKSQNYDEAKRIVSELIENGKITFKFTNQQENNLHMQSYYDN